jgi:hypothetical protein
MKLTHSIYLTTANLQSGKKLPNTPTVFEARMREIRSFIEYESAIAHILMNYLS